MSTVAVELPEAWDELMEEKGYQPLRSFYLEPIDDEGHDPLTSVEELPAAPAPPASGKTQVRYYDLSGHGSTRPFDGLNIEVTNDSEKGTSSKKYIRVN